MQPVMKITLRRTCYTSVLYLSYLFSFLFAVTTAFMNHFLPLTYRTTSFSIVIFSTPAFLESLLVQYFVHPIFCLSHCLHGAVYFPSIPVMLFLQYLLFVHFSLLNPYRSFFSTSLSLPFVFYRLISYHFSFIICSLAIAYLYITTFLSTSCTSTIFFVISFTITALWRIRRPIRSPISLPHYSFLVSLFLSSRNLITKTADTRHESDKKNHISEAKFSKSL